MISGLVIAPGGGARKILVRAAGPALGMFGVTGTLADPAIAVLDANATQIAANDNWGTGNNVAALTAAFTAAGAFVFPAGSSDAALVVDLAPGSYTIQVSGVGNTAGVALVEVYDLTPATGETVSLAATTATTDTKGAAPGVFTFSRTGSTAAPLTVYYGIGGSAVSGVDYASLPGSVTIPAGATSATVNLTALAGSASATINKSATLTLANGAGYSIGATSSASVTIFYNPGTLFIAALRAPGSAAASTAFGTSTIQLSSDNTFALVNATFSNLSSPETAVYLRLGNPGDVGTDILRLPTGQVSGATWIFQNGATFTAAGLVQALKNGQIFLDIQTAQYPTSELHGTFIQSSGTLAFNPLAAALLLGIAALLLLRAWRVVPNAPPLSRSSAAAAPRPPIEHRESRIPLRSTASAISLPT